jgi:hypothetical protein
MILEYLVNNSRKPEAIGKVLKAQEELLAIVTILKESIDGRIGVEGENRFT